MNWFSKSVLFLGLLASFSIFADSGNEIPDCLDNQGNVLAPNNTAVAHWETSTADEFLARAHVTGTIRKVYHHTGGHFHFSIDLGRARGGTLEIIYNDSFGALPWLNVGDTVEACGDYITSQHQDGHYPPSPDGAILHWVHESDGHGSHPGGYVAINGDVYGQGK